MIQTIEPIKSLDDLQHVPVEENLLFIYKGETEQFTVVGAFLDYTCKKGLIFKNASMRSYIVDTVQTKDFSDILACYKDYSEFYDGVNETTIDAFSKDYFTDTSKYELHTFVPKD